MIQRPGRHRGPAKEPVQPPGPDAHPLAGTRLPEDVIVSWVREQLRDRLRRNNAALARELQDRDRRRHEHTAAPSADIEAEP